MALLTGGGALCATLAWSLVAGNGRFVERRATALSSPVEAANVRQENNETEAAEHAGPSDASATCSTTPSDPSGAWQTEKFHDAAKSQLKRFGKLLAHPDELDEDNIRAVVDHQFKTDGLRPDDLIEVFRDARYRVLRSSSDEGRMSPGRANTPFREAAG